MAEDRDDKPTPEEEYDSAFAEFLAAAEDEVSETAAEEPVDESEQEKQVEEEGEPSQDASSEIDWSQVPEPYRRAYEEAVQQAQDWQHRYQSDQGRILAAQRRLAEMAQQKNLPADTPSDQTQPVSDEEVRKATGMEPERWQQLKEELPEVAEALESYIQSVRSEYDQKLQQVTQQIESRLEPIQQIEQERYVEAQLQLLSQQHPDWREIAVSEEFAQWLNSQPHTVRTLAGSQDASEVSFVLTAYKAAKGLTGGAQASDAKAIQQSRKQMQQRAAAPELKRKVAAPNSGIPEDDYDAAWEYFARES